MIDREIWKIKGLVKDIRETHTKCKIDNIAVTTIELDVQRELYNVDGT